MSAALSAVPTPADAHANVTTPDNVTELLRLCADASDMDDVFEVCLGGCMGGPSASLGAKSSQWLVDTFCTMHFVRCRCWASSSGSSYQWIKQRLYSSALLSSTFQRADKDVRVTASGC
jgi:hypothetical protein